MQENEAHAEPQDLLDLDEIMRAFGIETWTNLGLLNDAHHDQFQVLVEIQGKRYVLRECPETLLGEGSDHLAAFRRSLIAQGIPLAPFWLTAEGKPFAAPGEEHFELLEWNDGEPFVSSQAHELQWIASAGDMLARFHRAAQGYHGPVYRWPSEVQAGGLTQGWLNFAREKAEQCEIPALADAMSSLIDAWEAGLPAAMMAIGSGRSLPEFHIHGDYSPLNLRFSEHGVSEIMGLEASRWEKRLLEVAYSLFSFAGLAWPADGSLTRPLTKRGLDPERASLFLRAYSAIYPPVSGEASLLVDALALVAPIMTVNGPLEDIFYGAEDLATLPIEDALERLSWATTLPSWLLRVRRSFAEMW